MQRANKLRLETKGTNKNFLRSINLNRILNFLHSARVCFIIFCSNIYFKLLVMFQFD